MHAFCVVDIHYIPSFFLHALIMRSPHYHWSPIFIPTYRSRPSRRSVRAGPPAQLRPRSSARAGPPAQVRPRSAARAAPPTQLRGVGTSDTFNATSVPSDIYHAFHIIIFHLRPARSSVQGAPAAQLRAVDTSDACKASSLASNIFPSLHPIVFDLHPPLSSFRYMSFI